jgi:DNA-binding MarR family transcriptional regulator
MATNDRMREFAERVMKVERVLQESGITANPGRVVFVLTMSNTVLGVSQKEVIEATDLKKDVVSKLVASLVDAELLTQERDARMKRLTTTNSGRKLLSRVKASLSAPRPAKTDGKPHFEELTFF